MKALHINIQPLLHEAQAVLLCPLRDFAFEISAQTHESTRQVTFSLLRENVLKVCCSGEAGIFFTTRTNPARVWQLLRVLQKFGFILSFKKVSVESFEVVLPRHPVSMAA